MQFLNRTYLRFGSLALFVAACAFVVGACDSTTNVSETTNDEPRPTNYDATGNVTGKVLDRATNEPIANVPVSIDALTAEGEETLTDTTDGQGEFSFANLPAQSAEGQNADASGTYVLHIDGDASGVSGSYSDVRSEATLAFGSDTQDDGSDGSDGDANNLGASVTVPLSKTNASISARAYTLFDGTTPQGIGEERPVDSVSVTLVRAGGFLLDANGAVQSAEDVDVATTTTDSEGNFSFENLPGGLPGTAGGTPPAYYFEWQFPNQTVTTPGPKDIPLSGSGDADVSFELDVTDKVANNIPFQLVSAPEQGTDYDTRSPSFTFEFSRAVGGVEVSGDVLNEEELEEALSFSAGTRKALDTDGTVEPDVTISGNTVTVAPSEALKDGHEYSLSGLPGSEDAFFGARFGDYAELQSGLDFPVTSTLGGTSHDFSIGVSDTEPQTTFRIDSVTPAVGDTLDITDPEVTLSVVVINENDVPLITNDRDPVGIWADNGDGFERVTTTTLGAPGDFADTDTFSVTIQDPFTSANEFNSPERYKPLEVYGTLTSLNGVTGQSDTKTLEDRKKPVPTDARYIDEDTEGGSSGDQPAEDSNNDDDGGDVEVLEVDFSEPMVESIEGDNFSDHFGIDGGSNLSGEIREVDNQIGGSTGSTVVIGISDNTDNDDDVESTPSGDVVVDDNGGITDLAGNEVNSDANTVTP